MNTEDVIEWITIAENDFYSAKILNEAVRKPFEVICYLCAQSVEKYLKGYLIYWDIQTKKTHNLLLLNGLCIEKEDSFIRIETLCEFLNRYANDVRYPHKYEINEGHVDFAIEAVEKIRNFKPVLDLRDINDANV
jgi:HEPN domain-containing protein